MKIGKKILFSLIFFIIGASFVIGLEQYVDFDLIKKHSEPRFLSNGFLFTLPENIGYSIFLRTKSDNWEHNHYFEKSLYNVWYLFIPYNDIEGEFLYKLNINGYWENDPANNNFIYDKFHSKISVLNVPSENIYSKQMPVINKYSGEYKKVLFKYHNEDAKEVSFVCSKNNWSVFSYQMKKNNDGYWEISLDFTKGKFYYYFLVDWKKVTDKNNPNRSYDRDKGEVSYFVVD